MGCVWTRRREYSLPSTSDNSNTELSGTPSNNDNSIDIGSQSSNSSAGYFCTRRSTSSVLLGGAIVTVLIMSVVIISLTVLLCKKNKEHSELLLYADNLQRKYSCYLKKGPLPLCETRHVTIEDRCLRIKQCDLNG